MRSLRDPLLIVIILLSLVLGSATLNRGHDWGDDFASYIMQAKSIWNGDMQGFVEHNKFTISESSILIGPVAYPWGYPLILVPAYALKGLSPLALKLPGLFLFAGFLICLYLLTKNRLTRTEGLLLVALFAFNPLFFGFLNQIISDIPFLFFSTLALLLMTNDDKQATRNYVFLGTVIACAFFIRTNGILLLAAFLAVEFLQIWKTRTDRESTKKSIWIIFIVCGSFGLLWALYALIFPGGGESYFAQYQDFQIERTFGFVTAYFQVFSQFFGQTTIWKYIYYVLFVFFLIGLWMRRKEEKMLIIFSVFWMLLLITWPAWQGPRFIFPLLPIFIYFVFQGMKTALQKIPEGNRAWGQRTFVVFWIIIIGIFLFQSGTGAYKNLHKHRIAPNAYEKYSMDMYEFIREKIPPQSIIVFFKPRAMRMFTDRDSYMAMKCDELLLGNYVVINKLAENSQVPADEIDECRIPILEVFESRRFIVYEILK